ncbi:MAG TPA: DUF1326 domain-containing protein [Gaiellaceae bacterium]|nr:DUF1326 domain-containing protein [Gaiellaceae bacterium]
MSWNVAGTYAESCNCDAPCPCRRIDGVPGGRSTHGICEGVLSWQIVEGRADGLDLSDLRVVMAARYSDDEERSPWSWMLYLDERGTPEQRSALEEIWTGRATGEQIEHFPWAWKPSHLLAAKPARIDLDHTPRRQLFRVRDVLTVRIFGPFEGDETITCVIPGHGRPGEEVVAGELRVDDGPLRFEHEGVCGYASTFDYRSG